MTSPLIEKHWALGSAIDCAKREANETEELRLSIAQVDISSKVAVLLKERGVWPLAHIGYLSAIELFSQYGNFNQAIELALKGMSQGWAGMNEPLINAIKIDQTIDTEIIRQIINSQGVIQSSLFGMKIGAKETISRLCYYAHKNRRIERVKQGRSYALYLPPPSQ